MANIDSTNMTTDQAKLSFDTTKISPNENQTNNRSSKRKFTAEESHELNEKLLEIEELRYHEQLVYERLHSINAEKQHLQNLLNLLQSMDTPEKAKYPRSRQTRSQKIDSSSPWD